MGKEVKEARGMITVAQYAAIANVSVMTVSYRMRNNKILPGIQKYHYNISDKKYYLTRSNMPEEEIKNYFRSK